MIDDRKLTIAIVGIVAVIILGLVGMASIVNDSQQSPTQQSDNVVNESEIPSQVAESKTGAVALKRALIEDGYTASNVSIQPDGQLIVQYRTEAQNSNQIKSEMSEIAHTYADVAVENQEIGSLNVQSTGVILTVPADTAIAHGDGRLDDEAYAETFYYSTPSRGD